MTKRGIDGLTYTHTESYATVDMILPNGDRKTVEVIAVRAGQYVSVQVPSEIKGRFYIKQLLDTQYENYTRKVGDV
jgi:hypothetical protein